MYLTPTDKHWIIDIEADDLEENVSKVWVVCVRNAITKEEETLISYDAIKSWFERKVAEGCFFIGHNILKYDGVVLNRLVGTRIPSTRMVDTLLLSMLYSPALRGGHSLDSWGERLGLAKGQFSDWSHLSDEMIEYCVQDVRVTALLYLRLTKRMRDVGFSERSAEIEHGAWRIIDKQRKNGFWFDYPKAHQLYAELKAELDKLQELIYHRFPPQLLCIKTYKKCRKVNGDYTKDYLRHLEEYPKLEEKDDGSYHAYDWVSFNLASPQQRVEKLLELGWVPLEFTPKTDKGGGGNPKPTEKGELSPSLARFAEESGIEEVKLIATWMALNGRASAINNWMEVYNDNTECIHGNLWLASTLRYRHDKPNTANIPAVRLDPNDEPLRGQQGFYTYEARNLWGTRDRSNRRLVGVDAKGIQLRCLAHYLNNDEFTSAILSKDPHTANQKLIGLPTRALTKTITYATLMGAGDKKIANEARITLKEAKAAKQKFLVTLGGFNVLLNRLRSELHRTGRITLCDDSKILVSSDHMVIPYLLQGDESRIMKQAAIYVDEAVRKEKLDVLKVGDIHDEWQSDVAIHDIKRYIELCQECFTAAGRSFGYNLPIECDAKIGLTWAETH